jgi:hypothetical protein
MNLAATIERIHSGAIRRRSLWALATLTRAGLAVGFIQPGMTKVLGHRFTTLPITTPVGYFFDSFFQAQGYYRFVGICQVLAGALLLSRRTVTLGAALYFPIILNIFVITVSVGFGGLTPVITAAMAVGALYLLAWDFDRWKGLLPGFEPGPTAVVSRHADGGVMLGLFGAAFFGLSGLLVLHGLWIGRGNLAKPAWIALVSLALILIAFWIHRRASSRTSPSPSQI